MEQLERVVFRLEDKIVTNYSGYNQLTRFYHFCLGQQPESCIHLDLTYVEWIDGNLCALIAAMLHHLQSNYGHSFMVDGNQIRERFDVLLRNGFLQSDDPTNDDRQSTVPIQAFKVDDKNGFCDYVDNKLLTHRGMPQNLDNTLKQRIGDDLLEVFCNTHHHANTDAPFFVGGQYYPKQGYLKFTMVDLGEGFLPRIQMATNGEVSTDLNAIAWALEGNSSKTALEHCPGGLGIPSMNRYCQENGGILQIISNGGFWASDLENTLFEGGRQLPTPFFGTTINLIFHN